MVDFLSKYKVRNLYQHGFVKARSCLTNYIGSMFFEEIMDEGSPVDIR